MRYATTGETASPSIDFDRRAGVAEFTLHSAIVDGRCEGMCGLVHVFTS